MKIHNIKQCSPEWFDIRKLKLTASSAQEIATAGKGLDTYTTRIVSEYFSSAEKEQYTNADMERGNQLENEARTIYEFEKGIEVEQVGFVEMSEFVGCSPDGLIGQDGGLEIKCFSDKVYTELLLSKKIDSKYLWQIQMSLLATARLWWDFMAYNPNFKKQMYIERIEIDSTKIAKLIAGCGIGMTMLQEKLKTMKEWEEK